MLVWRQGCSWIQGARHRRFASFQQAEDSGLRNPLQDLNQHVVVPILPPEHLLFDPTHADVVKGQAVFCNKDAQRYIVHKGVVNPEHLPDIKPPEVAFIGRSNVGKSTLIKALFPGLPAKSAPSVSKKPGHTKVIKMYEMSSSLALVDLPGYGHMSPQYFAESVETYMQSRKNLMRIFLLVDGKVGFTSTDGIGLEMLEEFGKPYTIVFTKYDKATPAFLLRHIFGLREMMRGLPCCFPQPFLVSAHSGAGLSFLQAYIAYTTGNLKIEGL